jgi:phage N-6-adenine-methyltransferase
MTIPDFTTALTTTEQTRLTTCESIIEVGLSTFVDVGMALLEVRDSRLYRQQYATFEAYCSERWNMVASRARQLIAAANTVGNLGSVTTVTPANEAQTRELMGLSPDVQREVWQTAVETAPNGKITAAHVKTIVRLNEAIAAAPEAVQDVVAQFGVSDADTVDELTRLHNSRRDTFAEVAASGYIQPGDEEEAVHISDGYKAVRAAIDQKVQIHKSLSGVPAALQMSVSNEWYTPAQYIEAARWVMGGIDLDPASNPIANETVKAATYYTQADNGLAYEWEGRVWLNPPYGRDEGESNQAIWSARLIEEYRAGRVTEAVLLVNAVTDRVWFAPLWDFTICFTDHRIRFYDEDGEAGSPTHGNALIYLGEHKDRFVAAFRPFGPVVLEVAR